MIDVQRVRASDAPTLKRVRLAALQDSPSAFGSTYAAEADRPDTEWEERARLGSAGDDRATFFAYVGNDVVGIVGGYREDGGRDTVDLVSMWVSPSHRGRGVGRALVDAVLGWARDAGASTVSLWVTRGNDPAQRLYEAMGFEVTDEVQPLPSDPCKDEVRMVRAG